VLGVWGLDYIPISNMLFRLPIKLYNNMNFNNYTDFKRAFKEFY